MPRAVSRIRVCDDGQRRRRHRRDRSHERQTNRRSHLTVNEARPREDRGPRGGVAAVAGAGVTVESAVRTRILAGKTVI